MVAFNTLWANHPSNASPPDNYPCSSSSGTPSFENQCAIRLGLALARSGVALAGYTGSFCWHKHGRQHPLRVDDMSRWLNTSAGFVRKVQVAKRAAGKPLSHAPYAGLPGIIMWVNFWGSNNQGDHIDLWNGSVIAHGELDYFTRSEQVHFWRMA